MTTMRVVGECFFWYRLTRVFPDKFHRAVKRLCVCVLFVIVTQALSREFRVVLSTELNADDLVVIAETEHDLIKRLNEWKDNVDNRGIRVNMNRTKVMINREHHKQDQLADLLHECIMIRDSVFTLPDFYTVADIQCIISYICRLC